MSSKLILLIALVSLLVLGAVDVGVHGHFSDGIFAPEILRGLDELTDGIEALPSVIEVAEGNAWFQLYFSGDGVGTFKLAKRARSAGYEVLVLTVDVPEVGRVTSFGQDAEVTFDAIPSRRFKAKVDSIGAGTGAEFSLLPAQNATGNWVKVTQRIPVRLSLKQHRLPVSSMIRWSRLSRGQKPPLRRIPKQYRRKSRMTNLLKTL